jgi:hypothetical protein
MTVVWWRCVWKCRAADIDDEEKAIERSSSCGKRGKMQKAREDGRNSSNRTAS